MTELKIIDSKQIWDKLNAKMKNDADFAKEMEDFVEFYARKFVRAAKSEEKQKTATEIIEEVIYSQIFHGYYLQSNLIANEKKGSETFLDVFWQNPPGVTLNQIGQVMKLNFQENWHLQKGIESVNVRVLNEIPEAFDIFGMILLEAANFGAFKATIECKKYEGKVNDTKEFVFGSPYDLQFINPQIFIEARYYSNEHELWDMFLVDTGIKESQWIGSIHLSTIPSNSESFYLLTVSISDLITEDEKMQALSLITSKLPQQIKDKVQIRLYNLSDLDVFTGNK
ncbi:hypothetical protein ACIQYL_20940 [Lysinibacillus xylanilyticus]|uniref:hypothetical protein n=1 Tax=Lysinibacillus xylanilyticus TaxID=582475 RepID=UPI00381E50F2